MDIEKQWAKTDPRPRGELLAELKSLRAELAKAQQERDIAQGNTDAAIEDYNDALAELALARGSWQDIATAPKDGSCVLLGHSDKPTIEGYWCSIYAAWCDIAREREVTPQPTHWLPLPPPPIAHEATVLARANKRIENLEGQIDKDMDFTPI